MNDLVERLREAYRFWAEMWAGPNGPEKNSAADLCRDAADEIERLQTEVAALRPTVYGAVFDDYCECVRLLSEYSDGNASLADRVKAVLDTVLILTIERDQARNM